MKRFRFLSVIAVAFGLLWGCSEHGPSINSSNTVPDDNYDGAQQLNRARVNSDMVAEFEITLENMAPATGPGSSQPFSPPVIATHTPLYHVFTLGQYASEGVSRVAEDAESAILVDALQNSKFVHAVQVGGGVILPGQSATYTVMTKLPFKKISIVSMLVNTNDTFTGIDAAALPLHGTRVFYLKAYDAGTEKNTELKANIPGPCCGSHDVRVPTHQRITYSPGILGVGDLDPAIFNWDEPVAKLTITRTK